MTEIKKLILAGTFLCVGAQVNAEHRLKILCKNQSGEILGTVIYPYDSSYHDSHARQRCNGGYSNCKDNCSVVLPKD